ncbi:MAG: hypothetical protein JXD23_15075 [Spirochaetales bacterium]|nr:hypothetical protein [Spirochaetales bacterium]
MAKKKEFSDEVKNAKLLRNSILWSLALVGGLTVILSFFLPVGDVANQVIRSIGLTVAPSSFVTFFLSKYVNSITGQSIKKTTESAVTESFDNSLKKLESLIDENYKTIDETLKSDLKKSFVETTDEVIAHLKQLSESVSKEQNATQDQIRKIAPGFSLLASGTKYGVENIHINRSQALESFAPSMDAEVQKAFKKEPGARIWITSSSIKGFLDAVTLHFDGRKTIENIAECGGCDLRIMMTDPEIANLRANQEKRNEGEIPNEIKMNVAYLKRIGVQKDAIKFYRGTPTVFAIATSDRMFLNPYPYQIEAFRCFSIIVMKTNNPSSDIFHQYLRYHFEEPWESATMIAQTYWEEC